MVRIGPNGGGRPPFPFFNHAAGCRRTSSPGNGRSAQHARIPCAPFPSLRRAGPLRNRSQCPSRGGHPCRSTGAADLPQIHQASVGEHVHRAPLEAAERRGPSHDAQENARSNGGPACAGVAVGHLRDEGLSAHYLVQCGEGEISEVRCIPRIGGGPPHSCRRTLRPCRRRSIPYPSSPRAPIVLPQISQWASMGAPPYFR